MMITRIVAPADDAARAALMELYYHGARGYERDGSVSTACRWIYFLLKFGELSYQAWYNSSDPYHRPPNYIFDHAWVRLARMVDDVNAGS